MKANTKELFSCVFDTIEKLREKQIEPEAANCIMGLIKQANNVLKYELDAAIAKKKFDGLEIFDVQEN